MLHQYGVRKHTYIYFRNFILSLNNVILFYNGQGAEIHMVSPTYFNLTFKSMQNNLWINYINKIISKL